MLLTDNPLGLLVARSRNMSLLLHQGYAELLLLAH